MLGLKLYTIVKWEINPRCKLTEFVILDLSDIFSFREANTEG